MLDKNIFNYVLKSYEGKTDKLSYFYLQEKDYGLRHAEGRRRTARLRDVTWLPELVLLPLQSLALLPLD